MGIIDYKRRRSSEAIAGGVGIGGDNPVRLQSMTNTRTTDVEASVAQAIRLAEAGADLVRLTTQGVREAEAMAEIKKELGKRGWDTPLVADVHFNPKAAFTAADTCDKVRINPGNFADPAHKFEVLEFTDEEYAAQLEALRGKVVPFIEKCRDCGTAVRLGVNHGSLSDRIVSRYGDTSRGMVESLMEYLRIFKAEDFHNVVLSIKASNVVVMVETVRLLVKAMDAEGMAYPIHLGVTEAGNEDEGRIKSAAGIGALLAEGIGDTIRVSLSEAPEREIPVARLLRDYITAREGHPELNVPGNLAREIEEKRRSGGKGLEILELRYDDTDRETLMVKAAADFGALLLNGYGDDIRLIAPALSESERKDIEDGIMQAARRRFTKPDYIACPSCGRTLFNLEETLARVKKATAHLKGVKIAVMGCIVNGPGEMADADFGYVGAGPGRVSLYKGKELIRKNIPEEEAVEALLELIETSGFEKS